jgi:hypothetical protein
MTPPEETLAWLAWSMIATGVVTFFFTLFVKTAPYGRYSTDKGWGPLVPAKLAWFIMESPNLFMPWLIAHFYLGHYSKLITVVTDTRLANGPLLLFYLFHYIHRDIIYPFVRINGAHHKPMPASVMMLAFAYCLWNGAVQSLALLVVHHYPASHLLSWPFGVGFVVYVVGFLINVKSDSTLLSLKAAASSAKKGDGDDRKQVSDRYRIPTGGAFEYVSAANYFGEIVEWTGFAIACGGTLHAAAFALYTFSNLAPRAHAHHAWYKNSFPGYPARRKAIIPFVW